MSNSGAKRLNNNRAGKVKTMTSVQHVSLRIFQFVRLTNILKLTEVSNLWNVIIRYRGNDADSGNPESCPSLGAALSTINPTWTDLGSNHGGRGKMPANGGLNSAYHKTRKSKEFLSEGNGVTIITLKLIRRSKVWLNWLRQETF
jgi:hypothetical protein